jgi:outer membrane protein
VKNILGVLNVVLLIAVAGLYYLHFNGAANSEQTVSANTGMMVENPTIVYLNSDSLLINYEYLKDQQEVLKAKSEKLNNEYKNRAQGLQAEFNNYQQNSNNMTIAQARAVEEDLMKKQQNLKLYEQGLAQQLVGEEGKINQELYDKVSAFLKEYGEENELHMVVKYNPGSDVLYANGGMDITEAVIAGLNADYRNEAVEGDTTSVK